MMFAILQRIRQFFKPKRHIGRLPPEVLARVRQEADFLRSVHGVEVRALEAGEKAGVPKEANVE